MPESASLSTSEIKECVDSAVGRLTSLTSISHTTHLTVWEGETTKEIYTWRTRGATLRLELSIRETPDAKSGGS